jgi:hypothetical protein
VSGRRREVYLRDIFGAHVFHAIEIGTEDIAWLWTAAEFGAMIRGTWEHLITAIADRVGAGEMSIVTIMNDLSQSIIHIDKAGNTWLDHEYLDSSRYLPRLVPENAS